MTILYIIIFILVLLFISFRQQIVVILSAKTKADFKSISDRRGVDLIKNKAGVPIRTLRIVRSEKPYGLMLGIPSRPVLVLSSNLYETFTKDELEYVLLHEAAHYKYHHSLRELAFLLLLIAIGTTLILILDMQILPFIYSIGMGLIFGIISVQFAHLSELEADRFAVRNMDDPSALMSAVEKFKKAWGDKGSRSSLLGVLFQRGTSYRKRIKIAQDESQKRGQNIQVNHQ